MLYGCASPAEENRRALLTPYERCVETENRKASYCVIGCSGDLLSRNPEMVERGRQCKFRCEQEKNVALNSCLYRR
jgi:hypothetical protein